MSYEARAQSILKDSIKSAIYIDDKARSFFQKATEKPEFEEELTVNLYNNFKENGISLEIFKYSQGDETNNDTLKFITENRDFVILDWKLLGESGEEESLKILNEVVSAKHIHFATIYTSKDDLDEVLLNILSYFSEKDRDYYTDIKENLELENFSTQIITLLNQINLNRSDSQIVKKLRGEIFGINREIPKQISAITGIEDLTCSMIKASIALSDKVKSDTELQCPTYVDNINKIVVINNTIVTILKKSDNQAKELLENFKNHIINDIDSFNQLLGIELYNHLYRSSAITNDLSISFPKDALIHHRKKLKEDDIGYFFNSFMNEILMEKLSMSIRNRESLLLDDSLLNEFEAELDANYSDISSLHKMNVFYNSFYFEKENQILNFGDVFTVEPNENHKNSPKYLICLTALCDCLRPQDKIKSNFYFAEGSNIDVNKALELGDTAFISFLPNNITIKWTEIASDDLKKAYGPVYVKPLQYKVFEKENKIDSHNQIKVHYLDKIGQTKSETLNYIGTIRPNYAQRIANHAFSYPVRVGVDFVKI
ncbi:response regulator receiver domain [Maribacter antarcticus]|uniref:response regulator receiver domain n=1 Tax=Maribacter antarcticus TaxID=505250 RepID=UPI00047C8F6C|nr:response regulator receiver domain [Maribacter antarcticus]